MAEKKPSKYSDRGTIGSPEELDAYGVWVKSEPQDLTANMAEAVNFDAEAVPYADFDMEFDDTEESNFDFPGLEPEIPEISIESDEIASAESADNDNFDDEIKAPYPGPSLGRGGEEASTQLLMKIADELSAIRSELTTLKKEFAGVRIESVPGVKTEARHGGFFDGEEGDDEKITLTGDEMQNILTSADFSAPEEDTGFDPQRDPQREADEAALKELSAQNESAAEAEEEEEIKIDFDNLGISLDDDTGAEAQDEFPPLEAGADDEFETSSLEEIPPLEELPSEDLQEEIMPLEAFDEADDEELRNLRLEGASPFTPAPDNSVYLETDPFALDTSGLEETSLEETSFEDTSFAESGLTEIAAPEEAAPAETVSQDTISEITTELSLDDIGLDLDTDAFSIDESLPSFDEETGEEQTDIGALDISAEEKKSSEINIESPAPLEEETSDEISLESPISLEEETSDELSLESSISLEEETSDELSLESSISLEEETSDELSLESSPISLEEETSDELSLESSPISLEEETSDELSLESPISLEEETSNEISIESPISLEEETSDELSLESPISFEEETSDELSIESPISLEEETSDEISLESSISLEEETSDELSLESSPISLEEETSDELSLETPAPIEEEISGEQAFDTGALDLS
jgi:hypothetical protein